MSLVHEGTATNTTRCMAAKLRMKLYAAAKNLLYEPLERDGIAFTQRATKMLTLLFLAAREANRQEGKETYHLLPFVGEMADLGLYSAARKIHAISPWIARRLLEGEYHPKKDYDENKYLSNSWESLTARLFPLLTEKIVRCFNGSDFTGKDIITSKKPVTVYLCFPEKDLLALTLLIRLIWVSLMDDMLDAYDQVNGVGCQPVLCPLDELGRIAIPNLHDHVITAAGRKISLLFSIQSLSQLEAIYGKLRAEDIRNNCESHIFFRPSSQETAEYIQHCLGYKSGFAHSKNKHGEAETSEGLSEREVPLMTAQEIKLLGHEDIICFRSGLRPFRATRMNWRRFPVLSQRQAIAPPPLPVLPPLGEMGERLPESVERNPEPLASWHFDPELFRQWNPPPAANGLRKKRSEDAEVRA